MIDRIRQFFDQHLAPSEQTDGDDATALRHAAAALLLEMTRADHNVRDEECATVEQAVRDHLGLSAEETAELIACAEEERAAATDYFEFTTLINNAYGPQQKVELVEMLWRIAYADGELHRYEEHLVRKIAELLYVPHRDFIAAKHRVAEQGG